MAAGRGSYSLVISNKEQTLAAVQKMRHGTEDESGRVKITGGGGGGGGQSWETAHSTMNLC